MMSLLFRRKRLVFSDNNFQDYEFTRLNTHVKKEMSEELTIILSNNLSFGCSKRFIFNNE